MKTLSCSKLVVFFSLLLILAACSANSSEKIMDDQVIKIKGSDTEFEMVESLVKAFNEKNKFTFEISGDGTSTGIDAFIKGEVNIANCSRAMSEEEILKAKKNGIQPIPVIVAVDAIAFIAHPYNPVDSLSSIQIQGILSGEINNWQQVGGPNKKIQLYGRNEQSGTYRFLEERYVKASGFAASTKKMNGNQEIVDAIIRDTFAIGYVGAGFIMDAKGKPNNRIWAINIYIDGENIAYSPYESIAVMQGDYPLVRPLYQYYNGIPIGKLSNFLQFVLSRKGHEIIKTKGFYPITSAMEQKNLDQGITF